MCKAFSQLMTLNYPRMDQEKAEELIEEAMYKVFKDRVMKEVGARNERPAVRQQLWLRKEEGTQSGAA